MAKRLEEEEEKEESSDCSPLVGDDDIASVFFSTAACIAAIKEMGCAATVFVLNFREIDFFPPVLVRIFLQNLVCSTKYGLLFSLFTRK